MTYYFKNIDGVSYTMCGKRNYAKLKKNPNWIEITKEEYEEATQPKEEDSEKEGE